MADIFGTTGDDVLTGTSDADTITTFEGNDTVDAGAGDDLIIVSSTSTGDIDGGSGFDTVRITTNSSVSISNTGFPTINEMGILFSAFTIGQNGVELDLNFTSIERVEVINPNDGLITQIGLVGGTNADVFDLSGETFSSDFNFRLRVSSGAGDDTIILPDVPAGGNASRSQIIAGDGNDTILGGSGNDLFQGLQGSDTITGGSGADVFFYGSSSYSGGFSDIIMDFSQEDRLEFDTDFTNGFIPTFIGNNAFSNVAGEMRYFADNGQTFLELDIDGDGLADETLTITNGEFALEQTSITTFGDFAITIVPPSIDGTSGNLSLIHI